MLLNGEFSDGPLTSFPYFVFDNLPFIECRETGLLDGRNVHERWVHAARSVASRFGALRVAGVGLALDA